MNEAQYTTLFKNDLLKAYPAGIYWHKVPDFPVMSIVASLKSAISGAVDSRTAYIVGKAIGKTGIFNYAGQKKPFDVITVIYGRPVAIEFKVVDSIDATLPFNILRDHQEAGLKEFAISAEYGGGSAFLGIFSRDPELIAFYDIFDWVEDIDRIGGEFDRKSFPKDIAARKAWCIITRNREGQKKRFDCELFVGRTIGRVSRSMPDSMLDNDPDFEIAED